MNKDNLNVKLDNIHPLLANNSKDSYDIFIFNDGTKILIIIYFKLLDIAFCNKMHFKLCHKFIGVCFDSVNSFALDKFQNKREKYKSPRAILD